MPSIEDPFKKLHDELYLFYLPNDDRPHGYIDPTVVKMLPWTDSFRVDPIDTTSRPRKVQLLPPKEGSPSLRAIADLLKTANDKGIFKLSGLGEEQYAIVGSREPLSVDRAGHSLFGVVGRGVHLTAYVYTVQGMKIWVGKRSQNVYTHKGKLDNSVAGGVSAGELPLESIIRECEEEASLPKELVEKHLTPCGVVSWMYYSPPHGARSYGSAGPALQYVYDLELPEDVKLQNHDDEVEEYYLWDPATVREKMEAGEFKPGVTPVIIDFFIRHGLITDREPGFEEIIARMHRRIPFPTTYEAYEEIVKQKA